MISRSGGQRWIPYMIFRRRQHTWLSLTLMLSFLMKKNKDQSRRGQIAIIIGGILATVFAGYPVYAQSRDSFAIKAEFGPYAVGFRLVEQYDYSRTFVDVVDELGKPFQGERARPIQTLIWYPAQNDTQHMTVGDYVALGGRKPASATRKGSTMPPIISLRVFARPIPILWPRHATLHRFHSVFRSLFMLQASARTHGKTPTSANIWRALGM